MKIGKLRLSSVFYVVSVLVHAGVSLFVATVLFSLYTLERVVAYTPQSGPPPADDGFAPAGNSLIVFLGCEVAIILTALSEAVHSLLSEAS